MKCENCGYYNKSDNEKCEQCGSPLNKNPILKYKEKATNTIPNGKTFNNSEKLIIALFAIGVLMLIASAVIPSDFDVSSVWGPESNISDDTPIVMNDTKIRIDTWIQVVSSGFSGEDHIIVNANVNDINNYPVNGGTASITINGVKYSGNVENGNVNILIPKIDNNKRQITVVYEGNDEYNPSEIITTIEITKISTKIDVEEVNGSLVATLKTVNDEIIKDSTINVMYSDNITVDKKTDGNGRITIDANLTPGLNKIKVAYAGNEKYNPCEKIIEIENNKMDTKMDVEEQNDIIKASLKTVNGEAIKDSTINILYSDNTSIDKKTGADGSITIDSKLNQGIKRIKFSYNGSDQYNPCEKIFEIESKKSDTHIDAQFNQQEKSISVKLTDNTNMPISNVNLKIIDNGNQKMESTDNYGITNIKIDEGSHNVSIKYEGNNTFNPSETTINVIVEENDINDTVDNHTNDTMDNGTVNNTESMLNNTENKNISENTSKNNINNTENNINLSDIDTKINTSIKSQVVKENSTIEIYLTTEDNKAISNEYIKIKLDNGTEITKKTDSNGMIILDLDDYSSIDKMEFEFLGDDDYSSSDDYITI